MEIATTVTVLVGLLGAGVTYGTDTFAAVVWDSALKRLTKAELTRVVGFVHYYGDRRLPIPGAIGAVAIVSSAILAFVGHDPAAGGLRAAAAVLTLVWLAIYFIVAKPINARFTEAALQGNELDDGPSLEAAWNRVIIPRVLLLAGVIVLLGLSLYHHHSG
ncbi:MULTISPECIES: DUF1772 domain-containing protein [unclassified Mycobacterium]|uniref:DUF1772 domain-containing protein n=1 Tax=unclassified Mycobacterium TaxID=2642494 RepID=UPI000AFDB05E|nr:MULTISPECIES: DUF1772 domain-containing protein [unclassified Mycobacterium]